MNRQDVQKLFNLIEVVHPNLKKSRDPATLEAWSLILSPWTYEEVKQAVIERARESRYSPEPSELTPFLPPLTPKEEPEPQSHEIPAVYFEKFRARHDTFRAKCRAAGIPTPSEGRKQGLTYAAWSQLAQKAGV